jgi:hypothetical protein
LLKLPLFPGRRVRPAFARSLIAGGTYKKASPLRFFAIQAATLAFNFLYQIVIMADAKIAELEKKIEALTEHVTRLEDLQEIRKVQHKYGYYIDKCL